jgi:hypothetical protein
MGCAYAAESSRASRCIEVLMISRWVFETVCLGVGHLDVDADQCACGG